MCQQYESDEDMTTVLYIYVTITCKLANSGKWYRIRNNEFIYLRISKLMPFAMFCNVHLSFFLFLFFKHKKVPHSASEEWILFLTLLSKESFWMSVIKIDFQRIVSRLLCFVSKMKWYHKLLLPAYGKNGLSKAYLTIPISAKVYCNKSHNLHWESTNDSRPKSLTVIRNFSITC